MGHFVWRAPKRKSTVESVVCSYSWDLYHEERPQSIDDLRWRRLQSFSVCFRQPIDRELLRSRYGAPKTATEPTDQGPIAYDVFGAYLLPARNLHSLNWYEKTPDWAVAKPLVGSRGAYLRELIESLEAGSEPSAVAPPPPIGAGLSLESSGESGDVVLELRPPMGARELASFFGWTDAIGMSIGVHMSRWVVAVLDDRATGRFAWYPRVGGFLLEATLDDWASGDKIVGAPPGPTAYRRLGESDVVRYLQVTRDIDG